MSTLNTTTHGKRAFSLVALAGALTLAVAGCGGSDDTTTGADPSMSTSSSSSSSMSPSPSESMTSSMGAASDTTPVGPGCADYAAQVPSGAGSVEGMSTANVTTAASNNPLLTQLTAAVSGQLNPQVNLVDTLNGGQFTVFAPVDTAFQALPADTVNTLKTPEGADTLTKVLTYHVVQGKMTPQQLLDMKSVPTVEGQDVQIAGSADNLTVNGAQVICGNVQTSNATVYLIGSVLMPPS